ncbi:MAG: hypothetical protein OEY50_03495 [Nitrospinota bacterium]|nr:hypothetical protein [Nitrospinota bacterium]MDH5755414.1 hypothetical protein [Nitrospinota bacterium]
MSQGNIEILKLLLSETRSLFHQMKLVAEETYQEETMSGGSRGILHDLACLGPQSASQLEKIRPLSRLHIKEMLAPLNEAGYIRNIADRDDRDFPLIELTEKGFEFIRSGDKREMDILSGISNVVEKEDMIVTLDVLRSIRKSFDQDSFKNLVKIEFSQKQRAVG